MRILFLNLSAFALTGGIEKFNKCLLKALNESDYSMNVKSFSLYDLSSDKKYFPDDKYKGFRLKKISFVFKSLIEANKSDTIILGHINLAIIGYLVKKILPSKKVILITHGIEVWKPLKGIKKKILNQVDQFLAVSNYTAGKLVKMQGVDESRIKIFHNTLDPYFKLPEMFTKPEYLQTRYNLKTNDFVIVTLTRLSSTEKYKGYDSVLRCIPGLVSAIPNIKYIIAGKYDDSEKKRLDAMIEDLDIQPYVVFTGFLKDEEIQDHYLLGDVFAMPSKGEGFGIVFIEAASCGLRVIAGNQDGSVDALQNGKLGTLVNPACDNELADAILNTYRNNHNYREENKKNLQAATQAYFGFDVFKNRLQEVLNF